MDDLLLQLNHFCTVNPSADLRLKDAIEIYRLVLIPHFVGFNHPTIEKLNELTDFWIQTLPRRNREIIFATCALSFEAKDLDLLLSLETMLRELGAEGDTDRDVLVSYLLARHQMVDSGFGSFPSTNTDVAPDLLARAMGDIRIDGDPTLPQGPPTHY
ncbi:hypothetical protein GGR50DRAFT_690516 [Xylaria sp. CBS 124048]|nr:hypothetical protein GGR50DRAFT_690516 [Xylaria sp. CBS 124048]